MSEFLTDSFFFLVIVAIVTAIIGTVCGALVYFLDLDRYMIGVVLGAIVGVVFAAFMVSLSRHS